MEIKNIYILRMIKKVNSSSEDVYTLDSVVRCEKYPRLYVTRLKQHGYASLGEDESTGMYDVMIHMQHESNDLFFNMLKDYTYEYYRDDRINEII